MNIKNIITKNVKRYLIESVDVNTYISQIDTNNYSLITGKLFNDIQDEGWVEQLEDFYNRKFVKADFEYTTLNLDADDKRGLIDFDDDIINKFNDFDIELKAKDEYPFKTLDVIDYDNGKVYIIKVNV